MKLKNAYRYQKYCRYAVTRGTFPLSSQYWEEGDVYEQRDDDAHARARAETKINLEV